jgi:4-carboxymuconolactone decarboxylase
MTNQQPSAMEEATPYLADLTQRVLFGEVWEEPSLSKRDRSLITISVLTALYRTDQLRGHLGRALDNGVTKEEIAAMITHVAFYAGWPTGANGASVAKSVFDARGL